MPQEAGLDVLSLQWLVQQRIVVEIDLPDRQIIGSTPIGIYPGE